MELEQSFLFSSSRSKLIQVSIHMLTNSESLGFELIEFPRGIQVFHSGAREKKILAFPGTQPKGRRGDARRAAGGCLPRIPVGRRLAESQCSSPGSAGGGGIAGKELRGPAVAQASGAGRAGSPGHRPRRGLPWPFTGFSHMSSLPPSLPASFALSTRGSCAHGALTWVAVLVSPPHWDRSRARGI